ncbi:hypothetical protein [Cellulomonas alba]|uniref:Major facilitator superfamily (MFS) profile domain-containing protein n=1 Tax=Cellulomonas alba TaxID=3053467 RepID=A0ABT7SID4_9CELL|nr:hypothetical protein [Cellulomonas alba]MDM7855943.1 hypothetical protein [Cellulomonas alba]
MGRHASGAEPVADPRSRRRAQVVTWLERAGLGVAAGAVTLLVLRWADVGWSTALLVGGAALVAVPLFAWVASTVPGHAHGSSDDASDRHH